MSQQSMVKKGAGGSFAHSLRVLSTLIRMQLKEKTDAGRTRSLRRTIFKTVWTLIEFSAITAIITVVFSFVKLLGLFSLVHDIPVSVISLVFCLMLALSLITDTVGLMKSLYLSRDNSVLLTFPATPSLIFFSKLCVYYVHELRKSFMFVIPMFIAYGIAQGYALYYYPWLILMFALISVIPVLIAALLSIPVMFIYIFLNRHKALQYLLYVLSAVAGIGVLWLGIGLIPVNINFIETWGETYWQIQEFLKSYTEIFSPIYQFTELIVGKTQGLHNQIFHEGTIPSLLILLGLAAVTMVLCFLCSKPLFCRMASTPFEFTKKNSAKTKKNRSLRPFASALRKEWIEGIRSNRLVKLCGVLLVIMPMAIFFLNKLYSAMNTRFLGNQMTICFNVLIMLLILLMTNIDIASVYSRDGFSAYLNKVQPAPFHLLLFSKLFFPLVISLMGTVFTVGIFHQFSSMPLFDTVMLGVTVYAIYVAHLFSSAERDIMNPQYKQYATFNDQMSNPNERSSAVLGILLPALVFMVALLLSSRSAEQVWIKLAIIAVALAVFKIVTYLMKIKAFYKEKQL